MRLGGLNRMFDGAALAWHQKLAARGGAARLLHFVDRPRSRSAQVRAPRIAAGRAGRGEPLESAASAAAAEVTPQIRADRSRTDTPADANSFPW